MKTGLLGFLILLGTSAVAQTPDAAFQFPAIDARARRLVLHDGDIIRLSDSLCGPYPTELEKARAIFAWLGAHISYDCGSENRLQKEPEETVHPLFYTQQQVQNILKTRRTRCDGFAFMFKLLCNLQGIYCSRQEGYLRMPGEKVNAATVQPNHAWVAAQLDGFWYEIDPTAGAGHCEGKRFQRRLNDAYFRMSEKLLLQQYIRITDDRSSSNQGRIIIKF